MRKITIVILAVLLATGITAFAKDKTYGKGVSEGDVTQISAILASPDDFVGQNVRVEGTAVGVCAHRGCWLELSSDVEGETIRVKVEDGVIVFPKEIIGETVRVEGVFTANKAADTEKKCDRTKPGEAPVACLTTYQVSGIGAVTVGK